MRRINFSEPSDPSWKKWREKCINATKTLIASVRAGEKPEITDLYKEKEIKQKFYFNKNAYFFGKCAYCETYIRDFQYGDIEHFRPKSAVTDEKDNIVYITDDEGKRIPHPGYYWLAYEWQNLLPSCEICNRSSDIGGEKIGKHNRFPVKDSYATTPDEINNEKPHLINPLLEDPSDHLRYNSSNGMIGPISERGDMCIKIFALNIRDQLLEERKKTGSEAKALLVELLYNPNEESASRKIDEIISGKASYSFAGICVLKEYRNILGEKLGDL